MGKRLTEEERQRRELAYQSWVRHEGNFAATAQETGIDEKALRRLATGGRWWTRRGEEIKRVADEVERLQPLLEGGNADGKHLYVPPELRAGAAREVIEKIVGLGGQFAKGVRNSLESAVPDAVIALARLARGVNRQGEQVEVPLAIQEESIEDILRTGLVDRHELMGLPFDQLSALLHERMRERGISADKQA